MDTRMLMILAAIGATLMVIAVTTVIGFVAAQRLDRKREQSSSASTPDDGDALPKEMIQTSPAFVSKCRRAIHRFDSANSVTNCAVFFARPRKRVFT